MTTYSDSDTNTYFYIRNHNNSVVALVNENGSTAESYTYTAYGAVTVSDGTGNELEKSALGNRYTFQGREIDWSTGLYNFRARWFDAETGRWLSKDPIGINGGLNQYVFCGNNPVMFGDPEGNLKRVPREIRYNVEEEFALFSLPTTTKGALLSYPYKSPWAGWLAMVGTVADSIINRNRTISGYIETYIVVDDDYEIDWENSIEIEKWYPIIFLDDGTKNNIASIYREGYVIIVFEYEKKAILDERHRNK